MIRFNDLITDKETV
jgi:hypothetical protein